MTYMGEGFRQIIWGRGQINYLGEGVQINYLGEGVWQIIWGRGFRQIIWGRGKDKIFGGGGSDKLFWGGGKDKLYGGGGSDKLFGGRGKDRFVLDATLGFGYVEDFSISEDLIVIKNYKSSHFNLQMDQSNKDVEISLGTKSIGLIKNISLDRLIYKDGRFWIDDFSRI